jgi:hypothetical protein
MLSFLSVHRASAPTPPYPPANARRLQGNCVISGADVSSAALNVDAEVAGEIEECDSFPCAIAVEDNQAYSELIDACRAAEGVFHVFSLEVTCANISYQFSGWPVCWESQEVNFACTADFAEGALESAIDVEDCVNVASHTGTTDFSGSPPINSPVSCGIPSDAVDMARYNLGTELLGGSDCQASPCEFDVQSYHEYAEMVAACEGADGSLHVFLIVLQCPDYTIQFNDYPDCFLSQKKNSGCTVDYLEAFMDFQWDQVYVNCTTTSSQTDVMDFFGTSDVPSGPPALPTNPPVFPTKPPAAPTDPPGKPSPEDISKCLLRSVNDALFNLLSDLALFVEDCLSSLCIINVDSFQAYSTFQDACQEAKGAFHLFALEVRCDGNKSEYNKFPVCGVSETKNPSCDSDLFVDYLEDSFDMFNCTPEAVHTNTTDFAITVAPTEAPTATQSASAPQTPGSLNASSALSATPSKSSRSVLLVLILLLAGTRWI